MEITVTSRQGKVTDRFRRHLDEKLAKIPHLAPGVTRTDVIWAHESNPRRAAEAERIEITCHDRRQVIRAEAAADEEYAALDIAMARLAERLRRMHDRRKVHRGRHTPQSVSMATGALPTLLDRPLPSTAGSAGDGSTGSAGADGGAGEATPGAGSAAPGAMGTVGEASGEASRPPRLWSEGDSPVQVREKVHPCVPMSIDEALREMELVGHDFYLYQDVETGRPSVVYKRRGWSYGVITLDEAAPASNSAPGEREVIAAAG